jgi:hypothetical protein
MDEDLAYLAAREAAHAAEEALLAASQWYEVGVGIRPPRKSGKVRGVAREHVEGGGLELWHCDHDHAPGVRSIQQLTPAQREAAEACAGAWVREQQAVGGLFASWPVKRDE